MHYEIDTLTAKRRLLVAEAERWIGATEQGGNNQGQIVQMFQREIGGAVGEP